ncbi:MAG: ABC transporter substrate-binding protein [Acidimicrobiales bacterium]
MNRAASSGLLRPSRLTGLAVVAALLAACGSAANPSASPTTAGARPTSTSTTTGSTTTGSTTTGSTAAASSTTAAGGTSCTKGSLHLVHPGQLTVATDTPAYPPWFQANKPANGKGYESAVAYAVAHQLGFSSNQVEWVVEPFDNSYVPGPKKFDFDINEISVTPARSKAVTFSSGYYSVHQAVIVKGSSPFAKATSVAALKGAKLGAQVGTTGLIDIQNVIKPTKQPSVFNTTNDAVSALNNGQIDGIVIDLPTAVYMASQQVKGAKVIGTLPDTGAPEQFGLLFARGDPLVTCVDQALAHLRSAGTLTQLQHKWLAQYVGVPQLK